MPMKVVVNGAEKEVRIGMPVSELLQEFQVPLTRVAVERNRRIVPPDLYEKTLLEEGDTLEIVSFVGGG